MQLGGLGRLFRGHKTLASWELFAFSSVISIVSWSNEASSDHAHVPSII